MKPIRIRDHCAGYAYTINRGDNMLTTVAELAVIRQTILDLFLGAFVDDSTDLENFDKLTAVENQIENANFETVADRRVGNKILSEDHPSGWDNFHCNLFLRMQN